MVGWIILGVIAALLLLILFLPVGVDLGYEEGEFHLSAKVSALLIQILPKKPEEEGKPKKAKKPKKEKKKKEKSEEETAGEEKPKRKLSFSRDELLELVKTLLKGIGKFGRAWKVDRFLLHYVAAGSDPYDTAMTYGYVNAALSSLAPLCRKRFAVRDCSVWTDVDFAADSMRLDLGLALTVTLWKLLGAANTVLFGALRILIRNKIRLWKEKRALKKSGAAELENQKDIENETVQEEERMAANG